MVAAAFLRGLKETGFVDGLNVSIDYRFAENQGDRTTGACGGLVGCRVAVIAGGGPAVLAAKLATTDTSETT